MPTTYYVRKTGSDSNAGTSAGAAFLTIDKARSVVAAGDTVYIGAGTYREVVTMTTSGSAGNVILYKGDVDGVQTGDPGDVIWTGYLTDDKTAASNSATCAYGTKTYITLSYLTVLAGGTSPAVTTTTTAADHLSFDHCKIASFRPSQSAVSMGLLVDVNSACLFDTCVLLNQGGIGVVAITMNKSATADYDTGFLFRNCIFHTGQNGSGVSFAIGTANTFFAGGGKFSQCSFFDGNIAIQSGGAYQGSTSFPTKVVGCFGFGQATSLNVGGAISWTIVEDWNLWITAIPRSFVAAGPNSTGTNANYAAMFEDWAWALTTRMPRPFGVPTAGSPLLGFLPQSTQLAVGIPGTAADDATVGTVAWTNPNNAKVSDASFATCVLLAGNTGHYLKLTNWGFAVPGTATITQLRVEIIHKQAVTGDSIANSIKLVDNTGTIVGNDNSANLTTPLTTVGIISVSNGAADLWGVALTPTMVNSANFGVVISYKDTSGVNSTVSVDYVRIIVNYTDTSSPVEHTTDFTGWPRPAGGQPNIAVGAFERGDTAVQETSTTHTGSNAGKIAGPGYHRFRMPVDSGVTYTPSVYLRYDGSYGGSVLPLIGVANGAKFGVTDATASQVGASNTWEKVPLGSFVPTSSGYVTIYYRSQSTAAAGNVYFDTFSPT